MVCVEYTPHTPHSPYRALMGFAPVGAKEKK